MASLKLNVIVDRYKQQKVNHNFEIDCQTLRFNKDYHLVASIGHKSLLNLREQIDNFIKKYHINGKNTHKEIKDGNI